MAKVVVHISWNGRTAFTLDDEYVVKRDGVKLGELGGDLTPFVIDLDGQLHVLVIGTPLEAGTEYVYLNDHPVPVNPEATPRLWMAPPLPFSPGMTVTAVGKATLEGDELWRLESPPLTEGENDSVFGPGWIRYAPL